MSQGLTADKAFEHFDRSGVGAVDQDEFLEGLDKLHITLTPAECKQVRQRGREGGTARLARDHCHDDRGGGAKEGVVVT